MTLLNELTAVADVLQAHARIEQPERLPSLHGRASEWYEQNDLFSEAIRHALAHLMGLK